MIALTTRLPLRKWFDKNDPCFERPMAAIQAGCTLAEIAGEYEATFSSTRYAMQQMANDLTSYLKA